MHGPGGLHGRFAPLFYEIELYGPVNIAAPRGIIFQKTLKNATFFKKISPVSYGIKLASPYQDSLVSQNVWLRNAINRVEMRHEIIPAIRFAWSYSER